MIDRLVDWVLFFLCLWFANLYHCKILYREDFKTETCFLISFGSRDITLAVMQRLIFTSQGPRKYNQSAQFYFYCTLCVCPLLFPWMVWRHSVSMVLDCLCNTWFPGHPGPGNTHCLLDPDMHKINTSKKEEDMQTLHRFMSKMATM